MSAEVLPQPGQRGQRLQLQVRHKELQQGLPFHLLRSSKTAVSMGRGDLAFCSAWLRKKEKYIYFFSPSQANAPPPIAIQSKHGKHWTSVYVMVSEAVSGGGDPDVQS